MKLCYFFKIHIELIGYDHSLNLSLIHKKIKKFIIIYKYYYYFM